MNQQDDHSPFSLAGETALVTGGGSGLGLAMARAFIGAGAKVVIVGRREDVLRQAAAGLGPAAIPIVHDITEHDRAADLVASAGEAAGSPVSILVNNAGNHLKKWAVDTTPADFDKLLQTHVVAAQAISQAALPGMLERRHGSILFIASMASLLGIPQVIAYSAAKSAMLGMVRCLTTEVASQGVRVNAIAPGWVQSDMLDQALDADPLRRQRILARTPMGRFGQPDDIGHTAVFLCSPAARFISGVVLPVDGGVSIGF